MGIPASHSAAETHQIRVITRADALYPSYIDLRKRFVEGKGWKIPKEEGSDMYDHNLSTRHIASTQVGRVVGSIRFTPVVPKEAIEQTLSFSMLSGEAQAATRPHLAAALGNRALYDVTRLIVDREAGISPQTCFLYCLELFGAAMELCRQSEGDDDCRWIFVTELSFAKLCGAVGIKFEPMTPGLIDNTSPGLYAINPFTAFNKLQPGGVAHRAVKYGQRSQELAAH